MKRSYLFYCLVLLLFPQCGFFSQHKAMSVEEFCTMFDKKITQASDLDRYFPKSPQEAHDVATCTIQRARNDFDALIHRATDKRTFANTARALDVISERMGVSGNALSTLEMVSPDENVREACHQAVIEIQAFAVDAFSNKALYKAFADYVNGNAKTEKLSDEERYFLTETMRDFKREGLDLPDEKLDAVKKLKKELSELTLAFEKNIAEDKSSLAFTVDQLAGCDEHFVKNLKRDAEGLCVLGCDYPTYFEIVDHCSVESTRKRMYQLFNNRAYPQNSELLNKVIEKRDQLAHELGFASFAALDIDSTMAMTAERAEQFIKDLATKATVKMIQEFDVLKKDVPESVQLDAAGRFNPWDLRFVKRYYKEKYLAVDDHNVAEYFPVEYALKGVFAIYQKFLNLEFKLLKPGWAWHDDVQLLEIHDAQTKTLLGYVYLDLYPRDNKYSHACHCGIIKTIQAPAADGTLTREPSMAVVIANFPKNTGDRPALLKHNDVETFFHEFGHAMHFVLGSTELFSFAGTSVKLDFVEVPSQMFEEWLFDKELLKGLSSHYKTGSPLPDTLIDSLIALKKFDSGYFLVRQCVFSLLSLDYYKPGKQKDTTAIAQQLTQKYLPHVVVDPTTHMEASFGHLTNYGAKYYSYMWSKVYALDLFYTVKEQGLLNPDAGAILVNKILAKGGSVDPNTLLKDYLGREPGQEALFKDLGIAG